MWFLMQRESVQRKRVDVYSLSFGPLPNALHTAWSREKRGQREGGRPSRHSRAGNYLSPGADSHLYLPPPR